MHATLVSVLLCDSATEEGGSWQLNASGSSATDAHRTLKGHCDWTLMPSLQRTILQQDFEQVAVATISIALKSRSCYICDRYELNKRVYYR